MPIILECDSNITSLEPFLEGICAFNSAHPEALPQRSNFHIVDNLRPSRDLNRTSYQQLKKWFLKELIFSGKPNKPGIYFFFNFKNSEPKFYYIGISGTKKNQIQALQDRIGKHLLTKDFIFYALAFPQNEDDYYKDAIRFYKEGRYSTHEEEYRRQFEALKKVRPTYLAWISYENYSFVERDGIETHFIVEFRPPANEQKKNAVPNVLYREQYELIKEYLFKKITETSPGVLFL